MKSIRFLLPVMIVGLMLISNYRVKAQCAQCSAVVETNNKSGAKTTSGLNDGILYLLAAPYLAVATVGFIWFRKYRKKNVALKMGVERFHMN